MENSYPAEIERLMEAKGFVKQRGTGVSVNALAAAAGIHVDTATNVLRNGRASRPKNVQAVADALGISSSELLAMAGREGGEVYVGPELTRRMTDRERAALTEFLLATLERREREGGERADSSASITRAAGGAADTDDKVVPLRGTEKAQGDDMPTEEEFLKMASYKLRPGEDESRRREQEWSELGEESQDPDQ